MPRALIVAPPTIDIMENGLRPGGPGLYAGYALSRLGYSVFLYGASGWLTRLVEGVEARLGLCRVGYYTPWSMGAVFRLVHDRDGNKSAVPVSRPPALDVQSVLDVVNKVYPDLVILSPVYGEDCTLASTLGGHGMLVVDVQGYSRAGLECPLDARIVHVSVEDYGFHMLPGCQPGIILYTLGVDGVIVADGCRWLSIPGPDVILDDSTGAGDVFTALFSHHYLESGDALEAAVEAVAGTPRILAGLHTRLASTRLDPGTLDGRGF